MKFGRAFAFLGTPLKPIETSFSLRRSETPCDDFNLHRNPPKRLPLPKHSIWLPAYDAKPTISWGGRRHAEGAVMSEARECTMRS